MARLARIVLPNVPHHVTQRGNGRAQTFFCDEDYDLYRDLLVEHCRSSAVGIWGWCLMPNHVHLILTPSDPDGLRRALSRVHRLYAGHVHAREKRTGHFWQGRYGSVAMDEEHLLAAMAYVALNPVRASLCPQAEDWKWSAIHAYGTPQSGDGVVDCDAIKPYVKAAMEIIKAGEEDHRFKSLRQSETIGRPIGNADFMSDVERMTGRDVKRAKPGPKVRDSEI
jgi:putative transposase